MMELEIWNYVHLFVHILFLQLQLKCNIIATLYFCTLLSLELWNHWNCRNVCTQYCFIIITTLYFCTLKYGILELWNYGNMETCCNIITTLYFCTLNYGILELWNLWKCNIITTLYFCTLLSLELWNIGITENVYTLLFYYY
jgi:hypothetical protein